MTRKRTATDAMRLAEKNRFRLTEASKRLDGKTQYRDPRTSKAWARWLLVSEQIDRMAA